MSLHKEFPKTKTIESKVLTPQNQSELFEAVGKIINFKDNLFDNLIVPAVCAEKSGRSDYPNLLFVMQNNKNYRAQNEIYTISIKVNHIIYGANFISYKVSRALHFVNPSDSDWQRYESNVNKLKAEGFWKKTGARMN